MRLFVDHLTNVDFSYLCPERGLVGETWLASIELEGDLDSQGMVCDFGIVKKVCRQWLDEMIDHRLLIPRLSPATTMQSANGEESVIFASGKGKLECHAPTQSFTEIPTANITKSSVAQWCMKELKDKFAESVQGVTLTFGEESINSPYYHYSHGLKKHMGNCQRIAHGHRSRITIWRNDTLAADLMAEWARRWQDIYVGTEDDIEQEDHTHYHFRYHAQQGMFYLAIPKAHTYLVRTDTTVEHLAQHIADTLSRETGDAITVKAFEGAGKGAIASAN